MSVGTNTPPVTQSPNIQNSNNGACAGPFDYELLNREPNMVLNEMWDNGQTFCKVHANDGIAYFEMTLIEQVCILWTWEELYNRAKPRDPLQ